MPLFEIVDLLTSIALPGIYGTIYIKKQEELLERGQKRTRTRVEPFGLSQRLNPIEPKGLDIFEMLLPVLMPPATTEFRDDLLFPYELYPFQRAGVKWLFDSKAALLADDMGLGKTVQAITAFRALIRRSLALQALVICPKSVLTNWIRELERWAPELIAVRLHGNQSMRNIAWRAYVGKCHVLVTTYETVRQDRELITGRTFDLVITDEVQRIKNPDIPTSRAVCNVASKRRWALSGTPLENKLEDLVAVFRFVKSDLFQAKEVPFLSVKVARDRVRPFILRRRKEEALPELPEKVVDTKWLELSDRQRRLYDQVEKEGVHRLRRTPGVTVHHVLALIQELKQICNFERGSGTSSKIDFLTEEFLEKACQNDGKAIVFSQYVKTLEEICKHIRQYEPLLYTGQLSATQRDNIEQAFNTNNENKVLLVSLRAGGLGLNLTRANYVLHFDRWWNPAVERQAEDRAHRIGQGKTVFVTRLICQGTIEERIEQLLERKKVLFHDVVDELADVSLERVLSEEELFGLFGLKPPRRTREETPEGRPEVAERIRPADAETAIVIAPEKAFSNVMNLRRILRDGEQYIWWADLHFHARGLEEVIVSIDPAVVREIRILSGPAHVDERAKRDFARFKEEMARKSISAEWRVLKEFSHDRYIVSKNLCYNVPPINSLLRGSYSEILLTPNRPPFEGWWEIATPI
ncbi:MAG: DEAD/DEAH box helicase [Candidatus Methylomirabilales bacterium]